MPTKVHLKEPVKLSLSQPAEQMQEKHFKSLKTKIETFFADRKGDDPNDPYFAVKTAIMRPVNELVATKSTIEQRRQLMTLNEPWKDALKMLDAKHLAQLENIPDADKPGMQKVQQLERKALVNTMGEAKGELWDSLATNREWNRQKAINSLFLKGDWKNAQDAAMRQMQASPGDISSTGKSVTPEAILDNMHKFTSVKARSEYVITKNQNGQDNISVKCTEKPRKPYNPNDKSYFDVVNAYRTIKAIYHRLNPPLASQQNQPEVVRDLLTIAQAKGWTTFNVQSDNRDAMREALVQMCINQKVKNGEAPKSAMPYTFETLTLNGESNYTKINYSDGKMKHFTPAMIENLAKIEIERRTSAHEKKIDSVTKAATKDLQEPKTTPEKNEGFRHSMMEKLHQVTNKNNVADRVFVEAPERSQLK